MSLRDCIKRAGDDLSVGDRDFLLQELVNGSTEVEALDNLAMTISQAMKEIESKANVKVEKTDYVERRVVLPVPPQHYDLTREDKKLLAKLKKEVPGLGAITRFLQPDEIRSIRTAQTAQNLVDYLDGMPATAEMAQVAFAGRAKRGWYKNSQQAIEEIFGADAPRFTALLAALSPQTSVENNTLNALRVWAAWTNQGRPLTAKKIMKIMGDNVQGDKGEESVLGAWIPNAMRALTHPTPSDLALSGPKVNSFMLNLEGFENEVTSDAWMANYSGMDQNLFSGFGNTLPGKGPGYLAMAIRARQAAASLTKRTGELWTPAQVQETVWSFTKILYEKAQAEGRTPMQILQAGDLTHEEIGGTVDFEQLLTKGEYAKILSGAGYGPQLDIAEKNVAAREPSKLKGSVYKKGDTNLNRVAKRLDKLAKDRAAAAVRTEIQVGLSLGQMADQDGAIPGLVALTEAANKGDEQATLILQDTAWDAIRYLMTGIKSVKMSRTRAAGLYGGSYEPSLGLSLEFAEGDRVRVLSMLAKFGQNFNQEQVHVRGTAPNRKPVGHVFRDGSFVTQVVRFNLTEPLTREEAEDIINNSGLPGLTLTDGYLETYYAGDPENGQEITAFEKAFASALTKIGSKNGGLDTTRERLWKHGHGSDATGGYESIQGEFQAPQADLNNPAAVRVASRLAGRAVEPADQADKITEPQEQLQARIATAYEDLRVNALDDPHVARAYQALADEVLQQFDAMPTKVEAWDGKGEPYQDSKKQVSSKKMRQDVLFNNHLYFYKTEEDTFGPAGQDYSSHPLLQDSGRRDANGTPLVFNDLLRIVHDYYAHTMSPVAFGPIGEEAAWKNHMLMTKDPWARWALTSETRGQNSWVNFRPEVSKKLRDRPFAEQKVDLLPLEFMMTGEADIDSSLAALPGGDQIESPGYYSQSVYHGTGAETIEGGALSTEYIGDAAKGTGQTNFGWGLYFSSKASIANQFREWITEGSETNEGGLYMVEMIPDPATEFIDWNIPYRNQPPMIQEVLTTLTNKAPAYFEGIDMDGGDLYNMMSRSLGGDKNASLALLAAGIKGIKFRDPTTNTYGGGAMNYVVFDDSHVQLVDRLMQSNTFYSSLERSLDKIQQKKGSGKQFLGIIKKFAKKEEIEWLGLEEYLEGTESITLEDIKAFVHEGGVRIEEVTRGEAGQALKDEMQVTFMAAKKIMDQNDLLGFDTMFDAMNAIWREPGRFEEVWEFNTPAEAAVVREYIDARRQYENMDQPKFAQYVLEGGENYQELLLTLPVDTSMVKGGYGMIGPDGYIDERFDTEAEARAAVKKANADPDREEPMTWDTVHPTKGMAEQYTDGHWDEPNVMAHIRYDERIVNGKKVLFIQEIQSDWHQAGRKKGYRPTKAKRKKLEAEQGQLDEQMKALVKEQEDMGGLKAKNDARSNMQFGDTEAERAEAKALYDHLVDIGQQITGRAEAWNDLEDQKRGEVEVDTSGWRVQREGTVVVVEKENGVRAATYGNIGADDSRTDAQFIEDAADRYKKDLEGRAVPDAPFKKSWPLLTMKRMIRYAAENGFDQVAWTTGEQQADRYDLSKKIKKVTYNPDTQSLVAWHLKGDAVALDQTVAPDKIQDFIGKDLADKLLASETQRDVTFDEYDDGTGDLLLTDRETGSLVGRMAPETAFQIHKLRHELSGLDLSIGGEGMKGFYDKMLPRMTNQYIKKFGSKVGVVNMAAQLELTETFNEEYEAVEEQIIEDLMTQSYMTSNVEIEEMADGQFMVVGEDIPDDYPTGIANLGPIDTQEMANIMETAVHRQIVMNEYSGSDLRDMVDEEMAAQVEMKDAVEQWGFDVTDDMRESVLQGQAYFQDTEESEDRARFYPNVDGDRIIQLLNASDPSSFLHESGHLFLDVQRVWAEKYGMTENQQAMLDYLGVKDFKHIGVEQHELWAESFEVYLRDGKAPSLQLRRAFASFTRWLKRIYTTLRDRRLTRAKIDPEIRKIFDRLLATQEEIEIAAATPEYSQLFRSKEQSGMTDLQWAKYSKHADRVAKDAEMTLDEKVMAEYKKQQSRLWKEEKAPMVEEEIDRMSKLPIYQVQGDAKEKKDDDGVVYSDNRMDWHKLKSAMGKMPGGKWTRMAVGGGVDPALYAEAHGFASVKDMIEQIDSAPSLPEAADDAAEQRMKDKHGDILNDGTLDAEVREAMLNEDLAEMLLMELRAANKYESWMDETGTPLKSRINKKYLKSEAELLIATMTFKEIQPNKYYRQMIKAAQAAMVDENPGQAKINQLANHYLYKEAMSVKEKMEKQRKKVRRVQTQKFKPTQIEQEYIEAAKMLAMAYDMRKKPVDRARYLKMVMDWYAGQGAPNPADSQERAQLHELVNLEMLDPNMIAAIQHRMINGGSLEGFEMKSFDDLTAGELHGVVDMIDHLLYVGRQMKKLDQEAHAAVRETGVASIVENGGKNHRMQRGSQSKWKRLELVWGDIVNSLPSVVNMSRKLDGFKEGGWAHTHILQPLNTAMGKKMEIQQKLYAQLEGYMGDMSAIGLRLDDKLPITTESGGEISLSSEEVFMMAVYWGTESSRQAIMDGHHITANEAMAIMERLTPEQLQLVNATWALNESQWPQLQTAAKAMLGVAPPKLLATPFMLNGVQMTGGHMQLMYDSGTTELKDEQQRGMNTGTVVPMQAGSTFQRMGSGGKPVKLLVTNISQSIEEKTHYIAFAEVGRDLRALLNNEDITRAIEKKHGPKFYDNLVHAVGGVTQAMPAQESAKGLAEISRWARQNATMMHLAFSVRNVIQQFPAALIAMRVVGPVAFTSASGQFLARRRETVALVNQKSKFMENRAQVVNREAKEYIKKIMATSKAARKWNDLKSAAFMFQTMVDSTVAYPTWYAAYNQAMSKHGDEARAILESDSAVAESVGSGSDMHLGRIMQSNQNEFVKTLTLFGSWFNAYYQRLYKSSRGGDSFLNAAFLMDAVLMPIIVANLTQMTIFDFPDDEEEWWEYGLDNTTMFMLATIPVVRDFASLSQGFTPTTPLGGLMSGVWRIPNEFKSWLDGDQSGIKTASDLLKATGAVVPLPGSGNLSRSLDYIDSYLQGDEGNSINPLQMVVEGADKNK